jgi:hypothetical protein
MEEVMMEIWNKVQLKQTLENGVHTVVFTKLNGEVRELYCTLDPEELPVSDKQLLTENTIKKENDQALSVWDLDKIAWRAFRLNSIIEVRNH